MKFFDIKKRFFAGVDRDDINAIHDEEDDSWLDEPHLEPVPQDTALEVSPGIHLASQTLSSVLSETVSQVKDAVPHASAVQIETGVVVPDNDVTMVF